METRAACDVLEIPEYWRFDELGERTQARNHIMAEFMAPLSPPPPECPGLG